MQQVPKSRVMTHIINMYLESFSVQEVAEESKELMRIALEEVMYNVIQRTVTPV